MSGVLRGSLRVLVLSGFMVQGEGCGLWLLGVLGV